VNGILVTSPLYLIHIKYGESLIHNNDGTGTDYELLNDGKPINVECKWNESKTRLIRTGAMEGCMSLVYRIRSE
jgi:hypothetical protein